MTWLAVPAAFAAGYLLRHFEAVSRTWYGLCDWVEADTEPRSVRRFSREVVAALLLAVSFIARPRLTVRRIRIARRPDKRVPAPQIDPGWGSR